MVTFGQRLKELRKANKLGQKEVGAWINVSDSSIRKYEADTRTPSPNAISELARRFSVSTDYLLGYSDTNVEPLLVPRKGLLGVDNDKDSEWRRQLELANKKIDKAEKLLDLICEGNEDLRRLIVSLNFDKEGLKDIDGSTLELSPTARTTLQNIFLMAIENARKTGRITQDVKIE